MPGNEALAVALDAKNTLAIRSRTEKDAEGMAGLLVACGMLQKAACEAMVARIDEKMEGWKATVERDGEVGRRAIVESLNRLADYLGVTFLHPETGDPCKLIVIPDVWGGKFALESRKTHKRSLTKRHFVDMSPFKFAPLRKWDGD